MGSAGLHAAASFEAERRCVSPEATRDAGTGSPGRLPVANAQGEAQSGKCLATKTTAAERPTANLAPPLVRRFSLWSVVPANPLDALFFETIELAAEHADLTSYTARKPPQTASPRDSSRQIHRQAAPPQPEILGPIECIAVWQPCPQLGFDGVWLASDVAISIRTPIGLPAHTPDETIAEHFAAKLNRELALAAEEGGAERPGLSGLLARPTPGSACTRLRRGA